MRAISGGARDRARRRMIGSAALEVKRGRGSGAGSRCRGSGQPAGPGRAGRRAAREVAVSASWHAIRKGNGRRQSWAGPSRRSARGSGLPVRLLRARRRADAGRGAPGADCAALRRGGARDPPALHAPPRARAVHDRARGAAALVPERAPRRRALTPPPATAAARHRARAGMWDGGRTFSPPHEDPPRDARPPPRSSRFARRPHRPSPGPRPDAQVTELRRRGRSTGASTSVYQSAPLAAGALAVRPAFRDTMRCTRTPPSEPAPVPIRPLIRALGAAAACSLAASPTSAAERAPSAFRRPRTERPSRSRRQDARRRRRAGRAGDRGEGREARGRRRPARGGPLVRARARARRAAARGEPRDVQEGAASTCSATSAASEWRATRIGSASPDGGRERGHPPRRHRGRAPRHDPPRRWSRGSTPSGRTSRSTCGRSGSTTSPAASIARRRIRRPSRSGAPSSRRTSSQAGRARSTCSRAEIRANRTLYLIW